MELSTTVSPLKTISSLVDTGPESSHLAAIVDF